MTNSKFYSNSSHRKNLKIKESIDSSVENFICYGEGWIFSLARDKEKSVPKIDFSKFSWGKGYTLYIQNFGVLDPLFGDYDSNNPWLSDEEFVEFVIDQYGLQDKFIEFMKDNYDADDFSLYDDVTLGTVLDSIYEIDAEESIISEFLREVAKVVDDEALVGFTDKKDVIELVKYFGIEDDSSINIVKLDTKV